jgi:DNA-binding response OmpR family regulator
MIRMTWPQYRRSQCTADGRVVQLSPTEANVLLFLMLRPGWVSVNELIEFIYPDPDLEPDAAGKTVSVFIYLLRQRVGRHAIESNVTRGYRLARDRQLKEAA